MFSAGRQTSRRHRARAALGLLALAMLIPASPSLALQLPAKFQARTLEIPRDFQTGLQSPTAIDFAPDGSMYVAELKGRIKVFSSAEDTSPQLFASFTPEVAARGDRGLLGMKLDPEFPIRPYVYVSYTYDAPIGGVAPTHPETEDGSDGCEEEPPNYTDCLVSGRVSRLTLNPVTGQAVGGAGDPDEQVLVNSWCQQFVSHSMGDIEFDPSGALVVGSGDGATWEVADSGQFGNPCGDPPGEGGSLRAQDARTPASAGDPTDYSGSLIRIDPDTGEPMPDNPLFGGADVAARRMLAFGLRNPFRFEFRPGTDELYVGDVGWYRFEELDRLLSPPPAGQGLLNFGWPCYEGTQPEPDWQALSAPLCESLYQAIPSQMTPPIFSYIHLDGGLFPGDLCDPTPGAATSGLAFYDRSAVPATTSLPLEYDGDLFLADASRGCVWTMEPGLDGKPDPSTLANFATAEPADPHPFTPVDITIGPDGALYMPNFWDDSIVRVRYFPGDQPPIADLEADHSYGTVPLTVHLDASGSSGEGEQLDYAWDLDGDGEFDDGTNQPTAEWTYGDPVNVTARVRVTDALDQSDVATLPLYPGDQGPPAPSIDSPAPDLRWAVGDKISFAGSAIDPDDPAPDLSWKITIGHCPAGCHEHPLATLPHAQSGEITAPVHEYPSHLIFTLTATDSRGMAQQTSLDVYPRAIEIGVDSSPSGIPLTLNAINAPSPLSDTIIAGGNANIAAPATAIHFGENYEFVGWSDGGSRTHTITSTESKLLIANYRPIVETPTPEGPGASELRFLSRPRGIRLSVGASRTKTPFARTEPNGTGLEATAPRRVRWQGQILYFRHWSDGANRRRQIRVVGPATYVAVFGGRHRRASESGPDAKARSSLFTKFEPPTFEPPTFGRHSYICLLASPDLRPSGTGGGPRRSSGPWQTIGKLGLPSSLL